MSITINLRGASSFDLSSPEGLGALLSEMVGRARADWARAADAAEASQDLRALSEAEGRLWAWEDAERDLAEWRGA